VYLLTLKADCFKAVFKAHKEYARLNRIKSEEDIRHYLEKSAGKTEVKGRYGRWIILEYLISGEEIFENIESEVL
jgi:hypothetical protein